MKNIKKIRKFFIKSSGDEEKIINLLEKVLTDLDKRKNGIYIGKKTPINYDSIIKKSKFPTKISSEKEVIKFIEDFYEGVLLWSSPEVQMNVVPSPTALSIVMAALAARFNENSIWDHYGASAGRSEVAAVSMLADLIGYDKTQSGGIFTFGGTGCNLYAAKLGIEKASPDTKLKGIKESIHFFCSDVSHYSIKSAAMWTGVGMNNIRIIKSDDNNMMIPEELEKEIKKSIEEGAKIGTIFATMGTTDAFGLDPLLDIYNIKKKMEEKVGYKIHLHADAVIGWPYLTFKDDKNINHLSEGLQMEIRYITGRISELSYADSVGIDFHKTGWGPYICSAIIIKNKQDLKLLEKSKKDTPYLYHGHNYQPGLYTLESSRPNYAQKALANMLLLGKEGYESLITHLLSIEDYLRECLENRKDIEVLNRHNPAFVTDFRIYPNPIEEGKGFLAELHEFTGEEYTQTVNKYNVAVIKKMIEISQRESTSILSYTDSYKKTKSGRDIVTLKSYPMSPFIKKSHIDQLILDLERAKVEVDKENI